MANVFSFYQLPLSPNQWRDIENIDEIYTTQRVDIQYNLAVSVFVDHVTRPSNLSLLI